MHDPHCRVVDEMGQPDEVAGEVVRLVDPATGDSGGEQLFLGRGERRLLLANAR